MKLSIAASPGFLDASLKERTKAACRSEQQLTSMNPQVSFLNELVLEQSQNACLYRKKN